MTETETYLIFVALQCLAVPLAIFLTRPEKVQRSDGSKVKIVVQDSWRAEMLELWKLSHRKDVGSITSVSIANTDSLSSDPAASSCLLGFLFQSI